MLHVKVCAWYHVFLTSTWEQFFSFFSSVLKLGDICDMRQTFSPICKFPHKFIVKLAPFLIICLPNLHISSLLLLFGQTSNFPYTDRKMFKYECPPTLDPMHYDIMHKYASETSHFMSIIHLLWQWHGHMVLVLTHLSLTINVGATNGW